MAMTAHDKRSRPTDVAAVRSSVLRLARRMRAERPPQGMGGNMLGVLALLYREGPMAPGAIASAEQHQPQSLTRVFAELQRNGLISRQRSDEDHRQYLLAITADGVAALKKDMATWDIWLGDAMGTLSPAEQQVLGIAAGLMDRMLSGDSSGN